MRKPNWTGKKKRKPIYSSMQLVRQIRHWLPKNVKRVFDTESDFKLKDLNIKEKVKTCGLTIKEYEQALTKLDKLTTGKLALLLNQVEQDFLANWLNRMNKATKWAEEKKDYRAILSLEKQKMLMMKRLMAAGRIVNPFSVQKEGEDEDEYPAVLSGDPDFE